MLDAAVGPKCDIQPRSKRRTRAGSLSAPDLLFGKINVNPSVYLREHTP
jgi:hypothetical protein